MKFKEIVVTLTIFVVGSLIVTFLISPNSFNNFKSNFNSLKPSQDNQEEIIGNEQIEDELIMSCRNSFNECNNIVNQKFNQRYSLIKIEKFQDLDSASEFFRTWQTFTVPVTENFISTIIPIYCEGDCSKSLPLVLAAFRLTTQEGNTISQVVICDNTGELTPHSKSTAGC